MMKSFRMNLMQIFFRPIFYISVLGVVLISFLSVNPYEPTDVVQAINLLFTLSFFKKIIVIFTSLTYVGSFCSDWNNQYIRAVVVRCGKENYIVSKYLSCAVSCFLSSFIGLIIFCFVLLLKIPITTILEENNSYPPYGSLINTAPIVYLLITITIFSLAMTLWGLTGLLLSAYIPNYFVAISSPLVFSYILEELTAKLPPSFNIYALTRAANVIDKGMAVSFLYNVFIFIFFMFLVYLLFRNVVKRRITNEKV